MKKYALTFAVIAIICTTAFANMSCAQTTTMINESKEILFIDSGNFGIPAGVMKGLEKNGWKTQTFTHPFNAGPDDIVWCQITFPQQNMFEVECYTPRQTGRRLHLSDSGLNNDEIGSKLPNLVNILQQKYRRAAKAIDIN